MKGQFFLIGIILTAVIMLLSINFLSTNEKIFLIDDEDDYFNHLNYAYEYSIPDDWEHLDEENRVKIGICVSESDENNTDFRNSTLELYPGQGISCNMHSTTGINFGNSDCLIVINSNQINSSLDSDTGCNIFTIYYNDTVSSGGGSSFTANNNKVNASKILLESVQSSPMNKSNNISNYYINRNIKLSEVVNSNKTYNLTYGSEKLDFEGTI